MMKQAINIRLEKEIIETLDEMVGDKRIDNLKSEKSSLVSLEEVFKSAGINV